MPATANNFYRNPQLATIAYAVGILLFFLPFLEIKCNGTSMVQLSGKDMVFGSAPKISTDLDNFGKGVGNNSFTAGAKPETGGRVYVVAIMALLLGIAGLIFSLKKPAPNYGAAMIVGVAGAIALIALIIQVKADVNGEMKAQGGAGNPFSDQFSGMLKVSVDITAWFVLCLLSFLAAAFFSYKQKGLMASGNLPPAGAPQLNIQNPGDQSDFPAAPTGGQGLG